MVGDEVDAAQGGGEQPLGVVEVLVAEHVQVGAASGPASDVLDDRQEERVVRAGAGEHVADVNDQMADDFRARRIAVRDLDVDCVAEANVVSAYDQVGHGLSLSSTRES